MKSKESYAVFIENLKRLLSDKHIHQKELEEALHRPPQTVSRWINNRKRPDFEDLDRIAEYFGVSVPSLLAENMSADEIISVSSRGDFMRFVFSLGLSEYVCKMDVQIEENADYAGADRDPRADTRIILKLWDRSSADYRLRKECETLSELLKMVSAKRIDERTFRQIASVKIQDIKKRESNLADSTKPDELEDLDEP